MTKESLTEDMRKQLQLHAIAGATFTISVQPIAMRVDELVSGMYDLSVAAKIIGDDMDYLQKKADEVRQLMSTVPGAADLQVERINGSGQIEVIPDRIRMITRYGVNVS